MTFFNDWELWQKMCFVLGCLMAIVLVYATVVNLRNRHKIKKLLRESGLQKQRRDPGLEGGHEIPFGSRALESGIEIEGIWISKPNTPVPSPTQPATPVDSRPSSPARMHSPNPENNNSQQPPSPKLPQSRDSISAPLQDNGHRTPPSPAPVPGNYASQFESSDVEEQKTIKPNSIQRHSYSPLESENESNSHSRKASSGIYTHPAGSPGAESPGISGPSERLPLHRLENRLPTNEGDHGHLQALYSHRRYHAAEIGQLGSARNSATKLEEADSQSVPNPQQLVDELEKVASKERVGQ